jgi:hypothetical protein
MSATVSTVTVESPVRRVAAHAGPVVSPAVMVVQEVPVGVAPVDNHSVTMLQ